MAGQKPYLAILDVGHGNSAILVNEGGTVVIDAGRGIDLCLFLKHEGVCEMDAILISHADEDHLGGLVAIIASEEFVINRVCVNSDALQGSKIWDDVLYILNKSRNEGRLEFSVSLTNGDTGKFDQDDVHVEVLAPSLYIAGKGPGSTDREGRKLTSNSVSAVIRISRNGKPFVILPSDIDDVGFENLAADTSDTIAPVAVFPHHGGRPGKSNPVTFAKKFCDLVQPQVIIFSNGRGTHDTPLLEIVSSMRARTPRVRIMCTQISEHCAADLPSSAPDSLTEKFARGKEKGICCAGTINIELDNDNLVVTPEEASHKSFIEKVAATPMCHQVEPGR